MSTIQISSGVKPKSDQRADRLGGAPRRRHGSGCNGCSGGRAGEDDDTSPAEKKPNILFIMGDDIGWMQPSIYHEGLAVGETPNIDRIGHEGAKFMTYYAEQSCTAGRTAFITGMQPVRVGMVLPEIPGQPVLSADRHADARQVPATISATPPASSARTISAIPPSPCRRRTGSRNFGAISITSMPCSR